MRTPPPIIVTDLFPPLNNRLLALLRGLSAQDWQRPATPEWNVKDVAAHLLDTTLRRLSICRDKYVSPGSPKLRTDRDLAAFINQANAEWVKAARRLSPPILIELLAVTGRELHQFFVALDPQAPAAFPVSWAGDRASPNWFDIAREYTEKWHHQEQIRNAVGRPGLTSRRFLFPVLDTFMRALPHAYRDLRAPESTLVKIKITGSAGGEWFLLRKSGQWKVFLDAAGSPHATVTLPQDTAWRLFTKGLDRQSAAATMKFHGNSAIAKKILGMICIVA
jgi:uncharacterized protein (TIGR03083 family)